MAVDAVTEASQPSIFKAIKAPSFQRCTLDATLDRWFALFALKLILSLRFLPIFSSSMSLDDVVTAGVVSPLPSISISPATAEEALDVPKTCSPPSDEDSWETTVHLKVPPTRSPFSLDRLPSASPNDSSIRGQGLERDRFNLLLKATKERISHSKKAVDLRKEVASKIHNSKQDARRAHFMSRIGMPPSPSAVGLPVTPPASPALFHFTLPSPGLASPLALFRTLDLEDPVADERPAPREAWIEQVQFRAVRTLTSPDRGPKLSASPCFLPSLDQISARILVQKPITLVAPSVRAPLPSFLTNKIERQYEDPFAPAEDPCPYRRAVPPPTACLRSFAPSMSSPPESTVLDITVPALTSTRTPPVPSVALTEANLQAFELRAKASRGLNKLKRRTSAEVAVKPVSSQEGGVRDRRISAPPQLPRPAQHQWTF
ncbi:hypothetical protein SISNIDRAFT_483485 [Sistotremastrum niveocremeum HHB9708]|uniref:Uncharacterized protein n=1 Tax=Sistotremastrum niveocremeum HHB9708 TaxID=1314777 RepID=A0A164XL12_9AGAM|nr:hypothetical protein SISNIDRAFT_483485 [Sistotremastrum niveocremeum HHB9708]